MKFDITKNHSTEYIIHHIYRTMTPYELEENGLQHPETLILRILGQYIDKRLEGLEKRLVKKQDVSDKNRIY